MHMYMYRSLPGKRPLPGKHPGRLRVDQRGKRPSRRNYKITASTQQYQIITISNSNAVNGSKDHFI